MGAGGLDELIYVCHTKYVSFGVSGIDKSLSVVELTCGTDSWVLVDSTSLQTCVIPNLCHLVPVV